MRKPIPVEECLAATLRFLATGETYASLEYQFRISKSSLCNMVPRVCEAIYLVLREKFLKCPTSEEAWERISESFWGRWQFPNCLGAGDGKHIRLKCPSNSGSQYYNYKGFYSLVLMAFVGPNYEFLFVDVGCQGSVSDGGVFRKTSLCNALESNTLNIPPQKSLPHNDPFYDKTTPVDHFFVCDDAFPLGKDLMKPYPLKQLSEEQRIFNYRLSRARRVSENAFGILAVRFRVLYSMMLVDPEKATMIVLACCTLHNMLLSEAKYTYSPPGTFDQEDNTGQLQMGSWREEHNYCKLL